jgi:hypothetical protein
MKVSSTRTITRLKTVYNFVLVVVLVLVLGI